MAKGTETGNSLADFLRRHQSNPNLLEGVVDAVEVYDRVGDPDDYEYVSAFRVNPSIRKPYGDRRYFFDCPPFNIPRCELVVGDEVKIHFRYSASGEFNSVIELANITTGRVYLATNGGPLEFDEEESSA